MKKFKSIVLAAIGWLCSISVSAEDFWVDGIYYNIISSTDMTVEVTYRGSSYYDYSDEYSGDVTIPESVTHNGNTYSVTSIEDYAFSYCSGLTSVEIPNSVTSIGNLAFYECSSLTSVEIPNSVTSIGKSAFNKCSGLTSVVIGNGVTSIGQYAFYGTALYNNQPGGVVYLGNYLLEYKGTMPSNTSIEIKDGTLLIADYAFYGCSGLTSVEIPNSVTSIGKSAFYKCSGLTSVEIPNSVTSIGHYAFSECSSLTSVVIPNSVTSIVDHAFYKCSSLTSVVIPNSVTSIEGGVFRECSSLTSVEIGNSVTSIENYAFYKCSNLTSVEIPNSVTSIGKYAFTMCSGLTSVVIGNSVTSIGDLAFSDCDNLKIITSLNPTPPTTSYSSPFSNYDATLYVPFGAKTAYSEANHWKFFNIEELAPLHYELTDGEEYNEASDKTVNTLVYTRTLPNLYWNALYIPFNLPYDVIADRYDVAHINDVNGYDTDNNGTIDDLAMEIVKIKGGMLKANYPYLIKAKTEADKEMSITLENAVLYAAAENSVDCSSVYQNYAVTGIYTKKTAEELAGKLEISTSGAWEPLAAGAELSPFRLYLSIENRDNSPLKVETSAMSRMRIVERGETTGVETFIPGLQREDVIFDLSGRRVKHPVKGGVYIVNGKKRIF